CSTGSPARSARLGCPEPGPRPAPQGAGLNRPAASGQRPVSADDLARLDARRADADPPAGAPGGGAHHLDVGVPAARGPAMGVGDVVAESRPLAADLADSRHGDAPLHDDGRCWPICPGAAAATARPHLQTADRLSDPPPVTRIGRTRRLSCEAMARLDDPLDREFDPRTAKILASSLGVRTVGELLRHYPRRYEQRGELTDLASLRDGEHVTVLAQISKVTTRAMRNRRGKLTEVTVTDGPGTLTLAFFRQPWREKDMKPGLNGLFAGQVSSYGRKRQLIHPDCELLGEDDPSTELAAEHAAEIIPVYPATRELPSWKIAKAVRTVLDTLDAGDDPLPGPVRAQHGLLSQAGALRGIHRPAQYSDIDPARLRLKWDEAFVLQAVLAQRRRAADALPA